MHVENIDISRIDAADDLFRLNHVTGESLDWDISRPLFNPVWLQHKGRDIYRVVDGFRVIKAVSAAANPEPVPARLFPENINLRQLWELRVRKRARENNLSVIIWIRGLQRLMVAAKLDLYTAGNGEEYRPLGTERISFTQDLLDRIVGRSEQFEQFTDIHSLGYPQLADLADRNAEELDHLCRLLEGMQLKGKKLGSLLDLIDELSRGFGIQLPALLSDTGLSEIRKQLQPHQRYRHIKARLLTLRYPRLSSLLSDWDKVLKETKLSGIVDIRHDPYFEAEHLEFNFTAKNTKELRQQLSTVLGRADSDELNRLFDFINT